MCETADKAIELDSMNFSELAKLAIIGLQGGGLNFENGPLLEVKIDNGTYKITLGSDDARHLFESGCLCVFKGSDLIRVISSDQSR